MRTSPFLSAGLITLIYLSTCFNSMAQDKLPVRIEFDQKSKRIDLITEKELPEYRFAQRGSIQFFLGRLDTPVDFVTFFHDGIRTAGIQSLSSMEKIQEKFAIWRLIYNSGSKNTPRIHDLAVSFIPLSLTTNKPERRVYLLLNDLRLIDWGTDKK